MLYMCNVYVRNNIMYKVNTIPLFHMCINTMRAMCVMSYVQYVYAQ